MAEVVEPEPIDMDDVGEEAGETSNDVNATIEQLGSATEPVEIEQIQAELAQKVVDANTDLGKSLGLDPKFGPDPVYTESVIEDASVEDPETDDGKKMKQFFDEFQDKARTKISELQAENGESGKKLAESEKTKQSILEKYGPLALKLFLAIAALLTAYLVLKNLGKALSGCYQNFTCSSEESTPSKVGCTQDQCSCDGVSTSKCASPNCGGDKCANYYWQEITAIQALAGLPGMIGKGIFDPLENSISNLVKTVAIYGGIFIAILIVGFIVYKFATRKNHH